MKKNYFLSFVMLVCFMTLAAKANAQATSIVDLYGKWQFTATVETTEYGKQFASSFAAESEVVITKDPYGNYEAEVSGFAGGSGAFNPTFDAATQTVFVMNAPSVWGSVYMSFAEGGYPWSSANYYGDLEWAYDDATKTIEVDDFTLVSGFDHGAETAQTVAKFTNCKMVLVEPETIEIPNIAGDYDYEPVEGFVKNDSTFAYTFTLSLVATDETNKAYDATIAFGDFEPFTLPGTFDGNILSIPFDSVYLVDGENKYFFGAASPAAKKDGTFDFKYNSETVLEQWNRIYIRQDSVWTETEVTDEETGEVKIEGKWGFPIVQRLNWGYATRESEATQGFSWAGTFNVTAKEVIIADEELAATFGEWPSEFQIVIEERTPGSFYVTEFLGRDPYNATWGASAIEVAGDGKSATLDLTQAWGSYYLETFTGGEYLQVFDGSGEMTSLTFTLNDDGTISISNFFLQKTIYDNSYEPMGVVFYQDMTAEKYVEPFEWASGYFLTADVEVFDNTREWPEEFVAKIEWNEGWSCYLLTEFFGYDNVTSLTYGANELTVAEDTQSATYSGTGGLIAGKYPLYFNIYDKNAGTTALNFTVNEDGTVSMDDFIIYTSDYSGSGAAVKGALYTNVVLTKGDTTGIDSVVEEIAPVVEGIFDLMGRKYDEITAPGIYIVNGKKVVVK